MKKYTLVVAKTDKDIFEAVRDGRKKIETRANTFKYRNIQAGDIVVLSCDGDKFEKTIKKVTHFKSIPEILKTYTPEQINPATHTEEELTAVYYSFPGYKEKIAESGLLAFELAQ